MNDWADWEKCNAECMGGEQTRKRTVKTEAVNGGESCEKYPKEET